MAAHQSTTPASAQEARDVAEDARESAWEHPSFVKELFLGRFRFDLVHPHPPEDPAAMQAAAPFLDRLRGFLERYDADLVDRTGDIPETYVQELREMGAVSGGPRPLAEKDRSRFSTRLDQLVQEGLRESR